MSRTHYLWLREYEALRGADTGDIQFRAPFDATYDLVRMLDGDEPLRQQLPAFQIIVADELHDLNEASFRLLTMLIRRGNAFSAAPATRIKSSIPGRAPITASCGSASNRNFPPCSACR